MPDAQPIKSNAPQFQHQKGRIGPSIKWLLLALACCYFFFRGPLRALEGGGDFTAPYAASKAWLQGKNPYDQSILIDLIVEAGREIGPNGRAYVVPSLYPPATFLVLSPLSILDWPTARLCWLFFSLLVLGIHLKCLAELCGLSQYSTAAFSLFCSVLVLAPYHTGLALGQPAMVSIPLAVISLRVAQMKRDRTAGLILALSCLLKPQVAAPFVIYFLLRGRWRLAAFAVITFAVAFAVAIWWLGVNEVSWWLSWRQQAESAIELVDPFGPMDVQMIDWRPLLAALFPASDPQMLALVLGALTATFALWYGVKLPRTDGDLLLPATIAVWSLLVAYRRFYDAAILCLPIAWAIGTVVRGGPSRRSAWGVLSLSLLFCVPGAVFIDALQSRGLVPEHYSATFWWDVFVRAHQTWGLTGILVLLLAAIFRSARRPVSMDDSCHSRIGPSS